MCVCVFLSICPVCVCLLTSILQFILLILFGLYLGLKSSLFRPRPFLCFRFFCKVCLFPFSKQTQTGGRKHVWVEPMVTTKISQDWHCTFIHSDITLHLSTIYHCCPLPPFLCFCGASLPTNLAVSFYILSTFLSLLPHISVASSYFFEKSFFLNFSFPHFSDILPPALSLLILTTTHPLLFAPFECSHLPFITLLSLFLTEYIFLFLSLDYFYIPFLLLFFVHTVIARGLMN